MTIDIGTIDPQRAVRHLKDGIWKDYEAVLAQAARLLSNGGPVNLTTLHQELDRAGRLYAEWQKLG
jgi:hypothetical protein